MKVTTLDIKTFPDCLMKDIELDLDYIKETLNIYQDNHVYLREANYRALEIEGKFEITHYPFTKPDFIHYVTAPMLFLYLSQLGYVFVRCLVEDGIIPITTKQFFKYRNEGRVMLCSFDDIRLRNKIVSEREFFTIKINLINFHETETGIFGKVYFKSDYNEHSGLMTVQIHYK